jgi:hypothetical protein
MDRTPTTFLRVRESALGVAAEERDDGAMCRVKNVAIGAVICGRTVSILKHPSSLLIWP